MRLAPVEVKTAAEPSRLGGRCGGSIGNQTGPQGVHFMKRKDLCTNVLFLAGLFLAWPGAAQNASKFTLNWGGVFTEPVRWSSDRFDTGFNVNAGAGVNLVPALGVIAEFG